MPPTPGSEADLVLVPARLSVRAAGAEVVLTRTQFRIKKPGEPSRGTW